MLQLRLALLLALAAGCAGVQRRPEPVDTGGGSPAGLWIPSPGIFLGQAGTGGMPNPYLGDWAMTGNFTLTGALTVTGASALQGGATVTGTLLQSGGIGVSTNTGFRGNSVTDQGGVARLFFSPASLSFYRSSVANSGTNVAHQFVSNAALTGGTIILQGHNDNTAAAYEFQFHNSGKLMEATTDSSGTPGDATITTPTGQFSIGAGAGLTPPIIITSNTDVVTTSSIIHAVLQTADASCLAITSVVPASGSFTVTTDADCTGTTKVGFIVFN